MLFCLPCKYEKVLFCEFQMRVGKKDGHIRQVKVVMQANSNLVLESSMVTKTKI